MSVHTIHSAFEYAEKLIKRGDYITNGAGLKTEFSNG